MKNKWPFQLCSPFLVATIVLILMAAMPLRAWTEGGFEYDLEYVLKSLTEGDSENRKWAGETLLRIQKDIVDNLQVNTLLKNSDHRDEVGVSQSIVIEIISEYKVTDQDVLALLVEAATRESTGRRPEMVLALSRIGRPAVIQILELMSRENDALDLLLYSASVCSIYGNRLGFDTLRNWEKQVARRVHGLKIIGRLRKQDNIPSPIEMKLRNMRKWIQVYQAIYLTETAQGNTDWDLCQTPAHLAASGSASNVKDGLEQELSPHEVDKAINLFLRGDGCSDKDCAIALRKWRRLVVRGILELLADRINETQYYDDSVVSNLLRSFRIADEMALSYLLRCSEFHVASGQAAYRSHCVRALSYIGEPAIKHLNGYLRYEFDDNRWAVMSAVFRYALLGSVDDALDRMAFEMSNAESGNEELNLKRLIRRFKTDSNIKN